MQVVRGLVVKSRAGKDQNCFLVVLGLEGKRMLVCDGKHRPLSRPKAKNRLHLALTKKILPQETLETNRKIRKALAQIASESETSEQMVGKVPILE